MSNWTDQPVMHLYENGDRHWYLNGKLHREDGPAIENANGSRLWFINGQLHRTTGPAIERASGDRAWWLNGQQVDPGTVLLLNFLHSKTLAST